MTGPTDSPTCCTLSMIASGCPNLPHRSWVSVKVMSLNSRVNFPCQEMTYEVRFMVLRRVDPTCCALSMIASGCPNLVHGFDLRVCG